MRVFILSTGRSGSLTINKACNYIENFTSAHESLTKAFGKKRFEYPNNHIEVDNRLSWQLGQLYKLYGDNSFYVHLKRNRDKVAQSFFKRFYLRGSIIDAFCEGIRMSETENLSRKQRMQACYDYIDTVNSNIEYFGSDKKNFMTMNLENIQEDFIIFWKKIGATGNLEMALKVLKSKYNSTQKRKLRFFYRMRLIIIREWRHFTMCIQY